MEPLIAAIKPYLSEGETYFFHTFQKAKHTFSAPTSSIMSWTCGKLILKTDLRHTLRFRTCVMPLNVVLI